MKVKNSLLINIGLNFHRMSEKALNITDFSLFWYFPKNGSNDFILKNSYYKNIILKILFENPYSKNSIRDFFFAIRNFIAKYNHKATAKHLLPSLSIKFKVKKYNKTVKRDKNIYVL